MKNHAFVIELVTQDTSSLSDLGFLRAPSLYRPRMAGSKSVRNGIEPAVRRR